MQLGSPFTRQTMRADSGFGSSAAGMKAPTSLQSGKAKPVPLASGRRGWASHGLEGVLALVSSPGVSIPLVIQQPGGCPKFPEKGEPQTHTVQIMQARRFMDSKPLLDSGWNRSRVDDRSSWFCRNLPNLTGTRSEKV